MTTSWDCFDTLVTRVRFDPLTVFDWMGKKHGLANFTHRRKAAESRAPDTLFSIYEELAKDYQWTEEEKAFYKKAEIQAEIEQCVPIQENLRRVKDGDLIVSDMYLPREVIEGILRKNGLNKAVSIHVSTGGKSSGTIWKFLPPIDLHVGDNLHSDVNSPNAYGISAEHYTNFHYSTLEQLIGGDLALLIRVVRLANPYEPGTTLHRMWLEQSQLNVPALILAAASLPPENLAFVHRDCVHLQRIHEQLHGCQNVAFHCSRIAMEEKGREWNDYVLNTAKGRTIVDLQGTGGSIGRYWAEAFYERPEIIYVTGMMAVGKALITIPTDVIERFNSSPLGSLGRFPERFENEFDQDVLECQKLAIDKTIQYMPYFSLKQENLSLLARLVSLMYNSHTPALNKHRSNHSIDGEENDWPTERILDDTIAIGMAFA